jgi:hypothetical protein
MVARSIENPRTRPSLAGVSLDQTVCQATVNTCSLDGPDDDHILCSRQSQPKFETHVELVKYPFLDGT